MAPLGSKEEEEITLHSLLYDICLDTLVFFIMHLSLQKKKSHKPSTFP